MGNEQTVFSYTAIEDKHYFAGFLNLAWNNIEIIFNVFFDRFGISPNNPISAINNYLKDDLALSDYQSRIDFLKQYFPVIDYLDLPITHDSLGNLQGKERENKRRNSFRDNFKLLIKAVNDLRSYYTHYYHKPVHLDDNTFNLLNQIFLSVVKDVKKYKMKGDNSRHLLKRELKTELNKLIESKKEHLRKQNQEDKRVNLDPSSIESAVLNDAFGHLLYKEKVDKNYQSKLVSDNETASPLNISESGLLFLLGMFLHRNESEWLRSGIKGYKAKIIVDNEKPIDRKNNSLKYMATHWVFNYLSLKPIKERLNTAFHKETLLLQMADELSKVPDELYQTFTEEQRNEFLEDINEYIKEGKNTETLEKSIVIHPVIRKRYEDKFNYFVLRFLDEFAGFPTLRFQVHIGNYIHDTREKEIDGTKLQTQRVVKEKINVFGKLSDISKKKSDFFLSLEKNKKTKWEMFPEPFYNLVGNNIPIYIKLNESKVEGAKKLNNELIELEIKEKNITERSKNKPTKKEIINEMGNVGLANGKPTAILSFNELPALLYEVLVRNKTGQELEDILVKKLVEQYKLISTFTPDKILPTSKITKKLRKSSPELKYDSDKLLRAIDKDIQITQDKLKLIEGHLKDFSDKNNKRKYVFTSKELGQEAAWLADDIKRLMPKSIREKWKANQHRELQRWLAFYDTMYSELSSFLQEVWNLKDNNYFFNEWLVNALHKKKFHEFYKTYLGYRIEYFDNIRKQTVGFKNNKKLWHKFIDQQFIWSVYHERLYIIHPTENQKKELLLKPLVFPRGIFDKKPTYIKGKDLKKEPELFADWYRYIQDKTDQLQIFYTWKRDYKELFDAHKNKPEFVQNKYTLTEEQQFEFFKRKWDKKIRDIIGQDLLLNLMVKRMIKEMYEQEVELLLSYYYLTRKERIEKEKKAKKQSSRAKGDNSENIINDSFIWSMTVPYKTDFIDEKAVKLKEIGKFIRFLKDEKVQRIFSYDTSKTNWTKSEIEKELEMYEKLRSENVFNLFQGLEKKILEKNNFEGKNHPEKLELNGNPNFKKYITQGLLRKDSTLNENDINWIEDMNKKTFEDSNTVTGLLQKDKKIQDAFLLIYLRNKFAHNQLPIKEYYDIIVSRTGKTGSVTAIILEYIRQANENIMN